MGERNPTGHPLVGSRGRWGSVAPSLRTVTYFCVESRLRDLWNWCRRLRPRIVLIDHTRREGLLRP